MSRLQNYIKEAVSVESQELFQDIKDECGPFLKEYNKGFLWRGTKHKVKDRKYFKSRIERNPRDTPDELHNLLNDEFKKEFGWKVRNGIFVTPSERDAWYYGENRAYMFFPIGEYKYCFSTYKDLTADMDRNIMDWYEHPDYILKRLWKKRNPDKPFDDEYEEWYKIEFEKRDKGYKMMARNVVKLYKDTGLSKLPGKRSEVSFQCKGYYLVNPIYANDFQELMK